VNKVINTDIYVKKREVTFEIVVVMDLKMDKRGLKLIPQQSRAVKQYDVHEFIVTEEEKSLGEKIDKVAYIGFAEALNSGLIVRDDRVFIEDKGIGKILGFDETHAPNHINIVIKVDDLQNGREMDLSVGNKIMFRG